MVYIREKNIVRYAKENNIIPVPCSCPVSK
jgi:tRNA(Ile)-lysidine synthase TilS/MesJ